MATLNICPLQASSTLPILSFYSHQSKSNLSFNSHPKPSLSFSSSAFISISIKSARYSFKPRTSSIVVVSALKRLSEAELVTVPSAAEGIVGDFPDAAGVYAVFDDRNELQFIGMSRSIAASVLNHSRLVPELCYSVKAEVVDEPDRTTLTQAWKTWMEEHIAATGKVPQGNESGNTTWVKPPPKKKSDLRLTPGRHVQLTVPLEQLIDRLVKENKVVAFIKGTRSAPLCGFSQRVVGILDSERVDYESVDVLDEEYNTGLRDALKKYSNWPTFPQIFVNGELVGGCDILSSMHENGELNGLFKK